MNTNDDTNARAEAREEVIELGVASVETKGYLGPTNEAVFHKIMPGISEE